MITARFEPGHLAEQWADALDTLARDRAVQRLWDIDHTVVQDDPTEVSNRLGWLTAPSDSAQEWPRLALLADEAVDGAGDQRIGELTDVLILGMGGSSLFPDVLSKTFEPGDGFPRLTILDTTDPSAVERIAATLDPEHTLVVAASKSGSTIETRSHLAYFWDRHPIGPSFVAITDPGSALEALALERGFRAVVHGDAEVGGRFAALTAFGMLPAALMGLDGTELLDTAAEAAEVLGPDTPTEHHVAAQLGALIAVAARNGRDKLTFLIDPDLEAFGSWIEQLIAESTGKHGVGILPVVGEGPDAADPDSRLYVILGDVEGVEPEQLRAPSVRLDVEQPGDMGAQVFLWEFATTVAGIVLGINPFDQPDVESAKREARTVLDGGAAAPVGSAPGNGSIEEALALLRPGDALVITAFVDPAIEPELQAARRALGERAQVATTLGLGPRFLHSTGQLHKGGPDRIVVVQTVGDTSIELAVPGEDFTFGQLLQAQADGDLAALRNAGKRAVRVDLAELLAAGD